MRARVYRNRDKTWLQRVGPAAVLLVVAALVNVLWLGLFKIMVDELGHGPPVEIGGVMEVALIPDEDEPLEDPEDRPELASEDKLVQLDRVVDERPPEQPTEHVSEFDNRVEREVRAPKRRPSGAAGAPPGTQAERDTQTGPPAKARPAQPQALPLDSRSTKQADDGDTARAPAELPVDPAGKVAPDRGSRGSLSPRGLRGTPSTMRDRWGTPGSFDDLNDDIDEGAENVLNSRRWKYASFFNRVRNAVAEQWRPEIVHAARDPDGRVHGTKTRKTRLVISLNPDGSLKRIRLDRASDVDYLDEEAIRAVRAAAPFSNPPAGLVDPQSGLIEFGFAFIFEITGGRQIFRYQR